MPTSWGELKTKRLETMSAAERAEYDRAYAAALAAEVGERVRQAREAAGLSQRELARRMGTSRPGGSPGLGARNHTGDDLG